MSALASSSFLRRVNPLAKIAGPLPAMLFLLLVRDPWTPGLFLLAGGTLVCAGGGLRLRRVATVLALGLVVFAWLAVWFALLARGGDAASAIQHGVASALRIAALLTCALVGGVATDGADLVRCLVQQLRVPYRWGYGALAALRFTRRFREELRIIRTAQRVRGVTGATHRARRLMIPLLAGGIRHAQRVSLAMDARAFGAHRTRTERHPIEFDTSDVLFTLACWATSALLVWCTASFGALRLL